MKKLLLSINIISMLISPLQTYAYTNEVEEIVEHAEIEEIHDDFHHEEHTTESDIIPIEDNVIDNYVIETETPQISEENTEVYYFDEEELNSLSEMDFSSKRLLVEIGELFIVEQETVLSKFTPRNSENSIFLLQFNSELDAKKAYLHYLPIAQNISVDAPVIMTEESFIEEIPEGESFTNNQEPLSYEGLVSSEMTTEENPLNELNNQIESDVQNIINNTEEEITEEEAREMMPMMLLGSGNTEKVIALLDTGVGRKTTYDNDHVISRVTMLSDSSNTEGYDDNGHGTSMLEHILDEAPDAKILSVKVLTNEGKGDLSALYAGIMYAIEQDVDIISMSLGAYQPGGNSMIDSAIQQAIAAGITVVTAAGNDGRDAADYVPASSTDAYTIGAAKVNGTRQELSNYGSVVDYNVIANSTSEATARFAGMLYRDGIDKINQDINTNEVYTTDYVPQGGSLTPEGQGQTPSLPGEVTTPTNVDIVSLSDQVAYGAKLEGDKWVKTPTSDAVGQRYTFRVNYSTSGVGETEKGGVRFTIPKSILLDRNNNLSDTFEMSVPHENEWDETDDVDFVYYVDGDTIVLYNIRELSAAINGYFEASYLTNKRTFQYQDMKANNPFNVVMSVGGKTRTADDLVTYMNTNVRIVSTKKELPETLYHSWQPNWGEAPANANDYYYLIWRINSNIYNDSTQPYTFTLNDTVLSEGEVVGYKLAYQSSFTSMNSVDFQNTTNTRYDYVLTRHLKSNYNLNDDYWIFKNKVVATVIPSDGIDSSTTATSTKEFRYRIPRFTVPTGHFNQWKHADGYWRETKRNHGYGRTMLSYLGNKANEYSRYDLETLQNGDVSYLSNFDYAVYEAGYPYPWTYQDVTGNGPLDPNNYGIQPVKYELIDNDEMYLDDFKLNPGDYQIDHLSFGWTMRDAIFDDESQSFKPTTITYTDNDIVTFYGNFGDGNLIEIGTYNLKTRVHNFDNTYINQVETIDSRGSVRLYPVDGMIGYKIETSNAHYFTQLDSVPNYRLIGTERILDYIKDLDDITLINKSHGRFYESDGTLILNVDTQDEDYARIIERDSKIQKKIVSSANNTKKKYYNIGWRVEMNENYTIGDGETYTMEQESGTFYDILPLGGNIVLESVAVRTQNGYLSENAYEVSTTPNYKGSGRTLLTVKIKEPGNFYYLYYDTNHPWDSIKDYGNDVYNPVAYETGNKDIANGLPDDGGNLTDKTLMNDLDPNTNDKKFVYDDVLDNIAVITAALSGLQKKVKTDKDKDYSYDTITANNGFYQYRLRFMNSYVNSAKDMVLFDDLENYETPEGEVSDWVGTLQAVDLQQIRDKGIDVKMYINTQHVDMSQYNDDTPVDDILSGWILVDNNTDLTQAKAIAIDMRKATDGSDYVLDVGESVSAILYMQASNGASDPQGGYPETYNNIWIHDTVISALGGEETFLIHQDYTTVRLLIMQDIKLHKTNSDDPNSDIPNIKFRLKGTSDYGTEIDEIKSTDRSGNLTFKDIEKGSYILQEYESTADWLLDTTEYRVVIDTLGNLSIDGQDYTNIYFELTNNPRIHSDLTLLKRREGDSIQISNTKFKLHGTSDYGNDVLKIETTNLSGRLTFTDIELGTYILEEITPNPDYILNTTKWIVRVDEQGNVSVLEPKDETLRDRLYQVENTGNAYSIFNEPRYWNFTLRKVDKENDTIWIEGAEFTLTGISDLGTEYNKTVASNENGRLIFDRIEKGTYILKETKAPAGVTETGAQGGNRNYIADPNEYIVKIDNQGNVTIEGLTENQYDDFVVPNDRAYDGKITVVKKWDDDLTNEERPTPVVHLSTNEPKWKRGITVTKVWEGDNAENRPEHITVHLVDDSKKIISDGEFSTTGLGGVLQNVNVSALATLIDSALQNNTTVYIDTSFSERNYTDYFQIVSHQEETDKVIYTLEPYQTSVSDSTLVTLVILKDNSNAYFTGSWYTDLSAEDIAQYNIYYYDSEPIHEVSSPFGWIKNSDNTWTYTFNVLLEDENADKEFYVWEEGSEITVDGGKYTVVNGENNPVKVVDQKATITNTYEETPPTTIYAVQIYGIGQDEDINGNTMGLTFGPALGQNFMHSHIKHTATGSTDGSMSTDGQSHEHRCVHNDNWDTIVYWNNLDPAVYEQCVYSNCTHGVELMLSDTLKNPSFVYGGTLEGDGVGALGNELMQNGNEQHLLWNPLVTSNSSGSGTNEGGWGASRVRAMLNGSDELTMSGSNYATRLIGNNIPLIAATDYNSQNALISSFPQVLQENIGYRKTHYDSNYNEISRRNLKISYDKLWLLAIYEMAEIVGYQSLEAPNGKYQKFIHNNINISDTRNNQFIPYTQSGDSSNEGTGSYWSLRTISYRMSPTTRFAVLDGATREWETSYATSVAPCFALSRNSNASGATNDMNSETTIKEDNIGFMSSQSSSALTKVLSNFGLLTTVNAETTYDGSETDTTGWILGWTHFGTGGNVEFAIDPNKTLWIRPENGAAVGTMGSYSTTNNTGSPFYNYRNNITSVKIRSNTSVVAPSLCNYMFYKIGKQNGIIDTTGLDTSNVTDMTEMFSCSYATTLDVSNLDTSNVTNMSDMFYNSAATTLDVSNFDTSNVTNMQGMFYNSKATTINGLENFDTSNVTNMSSMFNGSQATTLDLNSFDTGNVAYMIAMFLNSQVTSLDLNSFDTGNVTNMASMFDNSQATTITGLNSFNTSNVTNMNSMFEDSQATTLELSNFNTSKVTNMGGMFRNSQATTLDLSSFDTSNVTHMIGMFYNSQVTKLILSEQMNGNTGSRFSSTNISGNDWVKVCDNNGNPLFDETQYTAAQVKALTESTTPTLSGTWMRKSSPEYATRFDDIEYISQQGVNANNDWVKNGDTWTYTFDVFDDSVPYYIWEDKLEDYTSTVMKPEKGYFNENGEKYYEILNTSTNKSSLEISKTVNGIETDQKFDFTIIIDNWQGTYVKSGVIFTDGVGRIKLAHGETKLIEGLPAGKTYTVTETAINPYTTVAEGDTGALESGVKSTATFVNTRHRPEDDHPEKYEDITIKKEVDGRFTQSGSYNFNIFLSELDQNMTYEYIVSKTDGTTSTGSFTSDESGIANVAIALEKDDSVVIKNVPVGSYYQVTEEAGAYTPSYRIEGGEEYDKYNLTGCWLAEEYLSNPDAVRVQCFNTDGSWYMLNDSSGTGTPTSTDGRRWNYTSTTQQNFHIELDWTLPSPRTTTWEATFIDADSWEYDGVEGTIHKRVDATTLAPITTTLEHVSGGELNVRQSSAEATGENQQLSTALEQVDVGEKAVVIFKNTLNKTSGLTLSKHVVGTAEDMNSSFNFTIEMQNLVPNGRYDTSHGRFVADEEGYLQKEIVLRNGESFEAYDIPVNSQYNITEQANSLVASYEIINDSLSAVPSDANTRNKLPLSTHWRDISEGLNPIVEFTNERKTDKLTLTKLVDGNMGNKTDEFEFDIRLTSPNVSQKYMFELSHRINFDQIHFGGTSIEIGGKVFEDEDGDIGNLSAEDFEMISSINSMTIDGKTYYGYWEDVPGDWNYEAGEWGKMFVIPDPNDEIQIYYDTAETGGEYMDLSMFDGTNRGDGFYRFYITHGQSLEIDDIPYGYTYEISEKDYSDVGYRTYINNGIIQSRTTSGTFNQKTDVTFRNVRGAAIPTEIRFWWWGGIPMLIIPVVWLFFKRKKKNDYFETK